MNPPVPVAFVPVDVVATVDAAISVAFGRPLLRQAVIATMVAEAIADRYVLTPREGEVGE